MMPALLNVQNRNAIIAEISNIRNRLAMLYSQMDATERFIANNCFDGNDVRESREELAEYGAEINRLEDRMEKLLRQIHPNVPGMAAVTMTRQR